MKEKRFFPEKGLLMLSGAAFLLLIVPAWVPGFVWCGVAAVLLCAAVWRLPVSRQRVRALLSNPVHMALSLAFNGALAVNFYHNWVDSQKMQRVAGVLGMENGLFVPLCAAFFAIAAAPAVGCVISYYISAGQEDYRRMKGETLRSGETGIPMGKALLILFAVSVVGISAILRANFYYMDDSPRAALGYKQWDYFSRYLSTALATLVHGGDYLVDAAPLPQMLAMLIMAVSGILMGYIFCERTTFSGWELAVLSILGLNPYFLGCVSFRFDAPYMAFSVLAAVVPLLYRNRNAAAYLLVSGLGILAVCTSYQAAAGIFPMLVVALALRMWNRGESIREAGLFCLKSAAGYALGLLFFKLAIMIPADTNYVGNALPSAGGDDSPLHEESEKLLFADFVGFQALLADCSDACGGSLLRSHGSGFPAENASRHRHDRRGADSDGDDVLWTVSRAGIHGFRAPGNVWLRRAAYRFRHDGGGREEARSA